MKRAHQLTASEEIVFVDSTSSCDPENHAITFMLCPCAAGAVPLAVLITKGQTEEAYTNGFSLLNKAVEKPFNGKTKPKFFITDDSNEERQALERTWPNSKYLLCIFQVAQAAWRWLWDAKNVIPKEARTLLMNMFQKILYSQTTKKAEEAYLNAQAYVGSYLPIFEKWNKYFEKCWNRRELYRDESLKGHHTNNFSEVAIRIFKDEVLCRVKVYNVVTILDFVSTSLENHYVRKFRGFANNRNATSRLFLLSMKEKACNISEENIKALEDCMYEVQVSTKKKYIVNSKTGCCSCSKVMFGRFCEHQFAVFKYFETTSKNFPPVKPEDKFEIAVLALGDNVPSKDFYQPFSLPNASVNFDEVSLTQDEDSPNMSIPPEEEPNKRPDLAKPPSTDVTDPKSKEYEENRNDLLKNILNEISTCDKKYGSTMSGLNSLLNRLKQVKSVGSWEKFLHTAGKNIPLRNRSGSAIHVQPASIARRQPHITKGSKRLPGGKPAGISKKKKREHNLSLNVKLNQPNAKLH